MSKKLAAIRTLVRQQLRDEFVAATAYDWTDDELNLIIDDVLGEVSDYSPYQTKETLTTTANSKDIDVSTITDLLRIDKLEYEVDKSPKSFRNFTLWGNTLTMNVDTAPASTVSVYLYCEKLHSLTEGASTLDAREERIAVLGTVAKAAINKAQEQINAVNVGGVNVPSQLQAWGQAKLALYRAELLKLRKPKMSQEYSTS